MAEFGVKPDDKESLLLIDSAFAEINDIFWLNPEFTKPLEKEIVNSYSQEQRRHHAISHLGELIIFSEVFGKEPSNGLRIDRGDLLWMMMYHDIVYDTSRPDPENVTESQKIAVNRLSTVGIPQPRIVHIAAGIDATGQHDTGITDDTTAFFLDADMSVLGTPPDRYDEYAQDVEYEFTQTYELDQYRTGRKFFLNKTLGEDKVIYNTDYVKGLLDRQTRANMRRELTKLEN